MLVKDLIAQLSHYPEDMEVHIAHGSGDHWHTTLAPKIDSLFEGQVVHSDYHRTDKLLELGDDETDSDARTVLILE